MLLVPVRQYLLPKLFKGAHLQDLDAAEYEEAPATTYNMAFGVSQLSIYNFVAIKRVKQSLSISISALILIIYYLYLHFQDEDVHSRTSRLDSGEVLDGIITRSRGEIRHSSSPKITSSTQTPREMQPSYSPRLSQRNYSPHLQELRIDRSPRSPGKGLEIKQTPSPGPSNLGETSKGSSSS